jgi:uncharacterized protein YjbI with pentapeptide repeats
MRLWGETRRIRDLAVIARSRPARIGGWTFAAIAALAAATVYGVALWRAPGWMHATTAQDRYNARVLVISVGGAIVVGTGLLYTARNYRLSRRGQVTDRFTVALERLGSSELYVRIGGVHALEHVMHDSADHHDDVIEVLAEFIRHRAPRSDRQTDRGAWMHPVSGPDPDLPLAPAPDVQAALTALAHRPRRPERLAIDLTELHLTYAQLDTVNLTGAELDHANLIGARLTRANLTEAWLQSAYLGSAGLTRADLSNARLASAYLAHAFLDGANLGGAYLGDADLTGAYLGGARLVDADLTGANLTGTKLTRANLRRANLAGANLTTAQLDHADLSGANLTGANLTGADLTGVRLTQWVEQADLTDANLTGANLTGADLTGTRLTRWLQRADPTGVDFTSARLVGVVWPLEAAVPEGWERAADGQLNQSSTSRDGQGPK